MTADGSLPAVILAAGQGRRLGTLTATAPKALLPVAGVSLLARQLKALRRAGICRIHVLSGFARARIQDVLPSDVDERFVPDWADSNNIVSLSTAADVVGGGFLLLNADVLFPYPMLAALATRPGTRLVIDDTHPLTDEAMKVEMDHGRVTRIAKTLLAHMAQGEYIGLARFEADAAAALFDALARRIRDGFRRDWYESGIDAMLDRMPVGMQSTKGMPWVEIDTPEDLARAAALAPEVDALWPHA